MSSAAEIESIDRRIWLAESSLRRRRRTLNWDGYAEGHNETAEAVAVVHAQKIEKITALTVQLAELKADRLAIEADAAWRLRELVAARIEVNN